MISEELITFKTAQLAKQAGFDVVVYTCYNSEGKLMETSDLLNIHCEGGLDFDEFFMNYNDKPGLEKYYKTKLYSAPTQSLLQKWIREVHNSHVEVTSRKDYDDKIVYTWDIYDNKIPNEELTDEEPLFDTYELALEQALQEALTLIINRKETNNEQDTINN